jgi:hypothetical protein
VAWAAQFISTLPGHALASARIATGWHASCSTKLDQTGEVVTSVNLGPKENGGRPGMMNAKPRIRPGRVVQGSCRNPLLYGLKGGEKSPVGNLAGSSQ